MVASSFYTHTHIFIHLNEFYVNIHIPKLKKHFSNQLSVVQSPKYMDSGNFTTTYIPLK